MLTFLPVALGARAGKVAIETGTACPLVLGGYAPPEGTASTVGLTARALFALFGRGKHVEQYRGLLARFQWRAYGDQVDLALLKAPVRLY